MLHYQISQTVHAFRVLKMIYFSYVHSVSSYGIIFWGNIFYSNCIFNIQKRVCMGSGRRVSCRDLFRQLNILPLQSQYIFSLLFFVLRTDKFPSNSQVQGISRRNKWTNLTFYQKGVSYAGNKICHNLLLIIKDLSNDVKCFKIVLKKYLWIFCV